MTLRQVYEEIGYLLQRFPYAEHLPVLDRDLEDVAHVILHDPEDEEEGYITIEAE